MNRPPVTVRGDTAGGGALSIAPASDGFIYEAGGISGYFDCTGTLSNLVAGTELCSA